MKFLKMVVILYAALWCHIAKADVSHDFVRITCMSENGMLDVEYRALHDSLVGERKGANQGEVNDALARHGFHDPHALAFKCALDGANYLVSAEQGPTSNTMCGGHPEIYLNVTRNGAPVFKDVVFGSSCQRKPSVRRFVLAEPLTAGGKREANICYSTGDEGAPEQCQWLSGTEESFRTAFPIDQDAIARFLKPAKR